MATPREIVLESAIRKMIAEAADALYVSTDTLQSKPGAEFVFQIQLPKDLDKAFIFHARELSPAAIESLIHTLDEIDPRDPRIQDLKRLHDELHG